MQRFFKDEKNQVEAKRSSNPIIVLLPMGLGSLSGLIDPDYITYAYENKFRHSDVVNKKPVSLQYAAAYHKALKLTCADKLSTRLEIEIDGVQFAAAVKTNIKKLDDIVAKYTAAQYLKDVTLQHFIARIAKHRASVAHFATVKSFEVQVMERLVEKHNLQSVFSINMQNQMQIQIDRVMRKTNATGLNIIGPGTDPNFALYGTTFDNSKLAAIEAIMQISNKMSGINLLGYCGTEQAVGFVKGMALGLARGDKSEENLAIPDYKHLKDVALYERSREHLAALHKLHGKGHDISKPKENKANGSVLALKLSDDKSVRQNLSCEHGLALWIKKPKADSKIYAENGRFKRGFHTLGENINAVDNHKMHTIVAKRVRDQKISGKWNMAYSVQEVAAKNMVHLIVDVDKQGKIRKILTQHHPEETRQQIDGIFNLQDEYNNNPGFTASEFLKKLTQIVNNEEVVRAVEFKR